MVISSEAPRGERSEIISQESRVQADPKRPAPKWGDDMIRSSWKHEAAQRAIAGKFIITESGCWEWTAGKSHGYGQVRVREVFGSAPVYVHRLMFVIVNRQPIPPRYQVCHTCDNPMCCNPEHLFLGTQADNLKDMAKKLRSCNDEKNSQCKLSPSQVEQIRMAAIEGTRQYAIAERFNISEAQVSRIVHHVQRKQSGGAVKKTHGNFKHGRYARHKDSDLV